MDGAQPAGETRSTVAARSQVRRAPVSLEPPGWRRHNRLLLAAGIGMALTGLAAVLAHRASAEREALVFSQGTGWVAMALKGALDSPVEVAGDIPAFFDATPTVTREGFARFARQTLVRHPEITAVEWFPQVLAADRERIETQARAEGVTSFEFREPDTLGQMLRAPTRSAYLPMLYMEPVHAAVLGLNIGADPIQRTMSARAASSGRLLVSQRFRMLEDAEGHWTIGIYSPVYAPNLPRETEAERRVAWRGIAAVLFQPDDTLTPQLARLNLSERDVVVLDEEVAASEQVVFESSPGAAERVRRAPLSWSLPHTFCDHRWRFVYAARVTPTAPRIAAAAVAAVGLLLTAMVMLALGARDSIRRLRRQVTTATTLGPYTLEARLGEGGMGTVYRAKHALLRRPTAIKVLHPERATDSFVQRFEREVRATSELTHPNTISVYDFGRSPDGTFYYAMEYLDGINLEELVARFGPVSPARAVFIVRQVCEALAEAHERAMVHRDIKPANIMLCVRGGLYDFVKVLDFGLVKELEAESVKITGVDVFLGTPLYMAPEAISGSSKVGASADLYAVGGLLYFLLTGRAPFDQSSLLDLYAAHVTAAPPRPSDRAPGVIPMMLDQVVVQCLGKNPGDRPASAKALAAMLAALDTSPSTWTQSEAAAWWAVHKKEFSAATIEPPRASLPATAEG